jgi:hypothetical protein
MQDMQCLRVAYISYTLLQPWWDDFQLLDYNVIHRTARQVCRQYSIADIHATADTRLFARRQSKQTR